jgi:F-type H+-transporting ATPase subunit b
MFVTAAYAQTEAPASGHPELPGLESEMHGELTEQGAGHSAVFPPMDAQYFPSQLLWLAISFGLFYYILKKAILPRLGGIIENRRDRIALDIEAAEHMKAEADAALAAYEQELAGARERSHKIAIEARDAAKTEADAERARIEGDLDAKLEAARLRIDQIKQSALADVGAIAESATQSIVSTVAGLDASPDEVAGAVRAVRA